VNSTCQVTLRAKRPSVLPNPAPAVQRSLPVRSTHQGGVVCRRTPTLPTNTGRGSRSGVRRPPSARVPAAGAETAAHDGVSQAVLLGSARTGGGQVDTEPRAENARPVRLASGVALSRDGTRIGGRPQSDGLCLGDPQVNVAGEPLDWEAADGREVVRAGGQSHRPGAGTLRRSVRCRETAPPVRWSRY